MLDSHRGTVVIEEGDVAEVRVHVQVEADADTEEQAARMRGELQLEMKSERNVVAILARPRERVQLDFGQRRPLDLDFRITVPRACHVQLRVRAGAITVGNLAGAMSAEIETGNVFFKRIDGSISTSVGLGDLIVSRCTGDVTARVTKGLIRIGTIGGRGELKNSSGPVEVLTAKGAIVAHALLGDVTVGFASRMAADSRLTASAGNIVATLEPQAACRVDASAFLGRVQTSLPFAVESGASGKSRLTGRLNGGGPLLTLHANGGNVQIVAGDVPFDEN